jgi:methyltransferase-like protein 6
MEARRAEYHSHDFNFEEWARTSMGYQFPSITQEDFVQNESLRWEDFFVAHSGGHFFKERNYLLPEFRQWLTDIPNIGVPSLVLEAGCGHGCSMFPLLRSLPHITSYTATDYSFSALDILQKNKEFDSSRVDCVPWDFTQKATYELTNGAPQVILCIFALSAVDPQHHETSLRNFIDLLAPGGVILFRDYGLYDMTMFRHDIRIGEALFRRPDGTIAYYFSTEGVQAMASSVGLSVRELEYATVKTENKKNGKILRRVFVHAVLQKNSV